LIPQIDLGTILAAYQPVVVELSSFPTLDLGRNAKIFIFLA
jgi:hypothetical protein